MVESGCCELLLSVADGFAEDSLTMKDVLVLFGGESPEYSVSCNSAACLIRAIDELGLTVHRVGVTREGKWLFTEATFDEIYDGESWIDLCGNKPVAISLDPKDHGYIVFDGDAFEKRRVDVCFPMIHGNTGEDGKIQGLLDVAGIPYVGSGVRASACCMDKVATMVFAEECGVPIPRYYACHRDDYLADPEGVEAAIDAFFTEGGISQYPIFVKPASTGSSVGISRVVSRDELGAALDEAAKYPGRLIVEQGIVGREIKIAVLGNNEITMGDTCECVVVDGVFNDFNLKYNSGGTHKVIPADLEESVVDELFVLTERLYKALGCKGFARVDWFVTPDNKIVFNDANTVPGFADHSIYPLMFSSKGVGYHELVSKLLELSSLDD